jgi:hypothetical protein
MSANSDPRAAGNHEMSSFSPGNTPQMGQQGYGCKLGDAGNSILGE